jgi:hypothetical protein
LRARSIDGETTLLGTGRISWKGADPGGSGVERYELAKSTSGGAYTTVSTTLARPLAYQSLQPGRSHRFRARAIDFAGNVGAWVYGPTITPVVVQQTSASVHFTTGWKTLSGTNYSGRSTKIRSLRGAYATYTFTGRSISLVSTMTKTRGKARIYIDGKLQTDVDLRSATTAYRRVVYTKTFTSSARHTIKVVVLATSGRPSVDIDAFVVVH